MKFFITSTGVLALVSSIAAQTIQSKPFYLILQSDDKRFDGYCIDACHEGAAIEGLCVGGGPGGSAAKSQYYLNTTEGATEQVPGKGVPGVLTYTLKGSNFVESEPMEFSYSLSSNVAHPQFSPNEEATVVAFDSNNFMNIQDSIDDTVSPPTVGNGTAYYRWYVCKTYYGYPYTTLDWVMGDGKPQNPSCVATNVKRVFV